MVNIPFWPFKKKKKVLSRERFLSSRPVPNPLVKQEESEAGIITLLVPIDRKGLPAVLSKSMSIPDYKKIQLDEVGSKVWRKIGGNVSMLDLGKWMEEEFKLSQREAELSLGAYFDKLSERGLVGLMIPPPRPGTPEAKEEAEELRKRAKELQGLHRKGKLTDEELKEAQGEIEKRLEMIGESNREGRSA